jgi:adenylyltransferase/sulfurtransferase
MLLKYAEKVKMFLLVYVVCRLGNDSQLVVKLLSEHFQTDKNFNVATIKDLIGGVADWSDSVDSNFPKY